MSPKPLCEFAEVRSSPSVSTFISHSDLRCPKIFAKDFQSLRHIAHPQRTKISIPADIKSRIEKILGGLQGAAWPAGDDIPVESVVPRFIVSRGRQYCAEMGQLILWVYRESALAFYSGDQAGTLEDLAWGQSCSAEASCGRSQDWGVLSGVFST
jgi:hypothetical protein